MAYGRCNFELNVLSIRQQIRVSGKQQNVKNVIVNKLPLRP